MRHSIASTSARQRALLPVARIFTTFERELTQVNWYHDEWLKNTLDQVAERFDRACDRWRSLYRAALSQREIQDKVIVDASRSQADKNQARRLRAEAEAQLDLLASSSDLFQSDFYSYRYFASEGFLPGYNFPRLPLSAYIPGRRQKQGGRDEYLNRPRFLAISEFGPRSIIYHEGSRYVVNRVILPVDERSERGIATATIKRCASCGHIHPVVDGESDPDHCEQCDALLTLTMHSLMRMQNVATKRRDRINSDEEERMRMGYDMTTGVRFDRNDHSATVQKATVTAADGSDLLRLTYGHAATIWRINLGWRRRKEEGLPGFVLDTERGYWATDKQAADNDPEDPMSPALQRIVPFVVDTRNCLLVEPANSLPVETMASRQPALKNAIQVLFQVEDNELAVEPLPDFDERRLILLYESAEGGAGVLRQLMAEPDAWSKVARTALDLCHFDPDTGEDRRRAPGAREDCEAACYDCLMSYYNQPDHLLLDRHRVRDLLLDLAGSTLQASPTPTTRAEHIARLKALCDSDLERQWLDFLEEHNLHLPDRAQQLAETCHTRPDFTYSDQCAVIYIDGYYHQFDDKKAEQRQIDTCLEDAGYTPVHFGYPDSWPQVFSRYTWLFGAMKEWNADDAD